MLNIEEFSIDILGHSIHVKEIKPKDVLFDTKIVFLHEGLGSIEQWKDFPELVSLKTGMTSIIFDRFGYGKSDPFLKPRTQNYLHEEALKILPLIIKKLSLKKYILIGHSDGGSIALIHGGDKHNNQNLLGIISMAAHIFVEEITIKGIKEAYITSQESNLLNKLEKYHGSKTSDMFLAWVNTWLNPNFINWNIEKETSEITCPLLIIQGKNDEYGSELQVEKIKEYSLGKSQSKIIPDCGHIPHLQAKSVVIESIVNFLKELNYE